MINDLRIEHKHEPDVYFFYRNDVFYDFRGFNSSTIPVNPVNQFNRYYTLYNELINSIKKNIDFIKNDVDFKKKQIFIHNLVIEVLDEDD